MYANIDGFEYKFYTNDESTEVTELLKTKSPNAYNFLLGIWKHWKPCNSVRQNRKFAEDFFSRIKHYGVKRIGTILNDNFWQYLARVGMNNNIADTIQVGGC